MPRHLFFVIFFFHPSVSISQQKVLLIGTYHRTDSERLKEIVPIATALESFKPGIICVEYPMPTDSASVVQKSIIIKNDAQVFQSMEALRKEWKIPAADLTIKIESLRRSSDLSYNELKRMELQQLYFLLSDQGNADYQGYLIMNKIENDSKKITWFEENFPGFETMMAIYENKRYRNDEYYRLVFPLAAKLNKDYLYPIDDLSTWSEYEKAFDRLHVRDTMDVDKLKFSRYKEDFFRKLQSLPKDSNQWIFVNSPQVIHDLLYVEGYEIDEDITNEDIKLLQNYWVLRNRMMARHIDALARKYPHINAVVFFGASHVGPVQEELNKLDKNYQVITLSDVIK